LQKTFLLGASLLLHPANKKYCFLYGYKSFFRLTVLTDLRVSMISFDSRRFIGYIPEIGFKMNINLRITRFFASVRIDVKAIEMNPFV